MIKMRYPKFLIKRTFKRCFTNSSQYVPFEKLPIKKLRNIGILAHIDAGKTTTTERMLYYSGTIRAMGEVHHGNTVTDYMEQERQRGITITAAAVSFMWNEHQFNLIDTPGHIDFTMEVEQSLGVLDGAVVVLDASAGVEAQTVTVWRQADAYRIPRIVYANKMDRHDGDIHMCVSALRHKLDILPLLLHLPMKSSDDKLQGIVDLISLEKVNWNSENRGRQIIRTALTETKDGSLWESAAKARRELVDTLSSIDDDLADIIIQSESLDDVPVTVLAQAIRKTCTQLKAFPVLCGSSYKNIGVQTLMDAVIDYLPSPGECNQLYRCFKTDLCAKAFKVQHDDQRGILTYLRLFCGNIAKGQKLYNIGQQKSEQCGPLYVAYADEYQNVNQVTEGNIAVVGGLKTTMSGDLVTSSQTALSSAKKSLMKSPSIEEYLTPAIMNKLSSTTDREEIINTVFGLSSTIPEPVFLCSIEPPSAAYQNALDVALAQLQREDPSLRVTYNSETGQTVLAGMGELHLEIIKERIIREYKVEAELGPLQIAYKETVTASAKESLVIDRKIGSTKHLVNVTMSTEPFKNIKPEAALKLDGSHDSAANLAQVYARQLQAVRQGVETALLNGPKLGCQMVDTRVTLHWLEIGRGTSDTMVAAAVAQCLRKVFTAADSVLLEPVMSLEVVCPESYMSRVMADLTRRRCDIVSIEVRGSNKVIECLTPLSELLGYSSALRSLSSGLASFTMEFHSNRQMSAADEQNAIRAVHGF